MLRTVGMIVFGAALLLLVMSMTILRNEPAGSHASLTSAAPVSPTYVGNSPVSTDSVAAADSAATDASAVQLSAYQQAEAAGGYLTGGRGRR